MLICRQETCWGCFLHLLCKHINYGFPAAVTWLKANTQHTETTWTTVKAATHLILTLFFLHWVCGYLPQPMSSASPFCRCHTMGLTYHSDVVCPQQSTCSGRVSSWPSNFFRFSCIIWHDSIGKKKGVYHNRPGTKMVSFLSRPPPNRPKAKKSSSPGFHSQGGHHLCRTHQPSTF